MHANKCSLFRAPGRTIEYLYKSRFATVQMRVVMIRLVCVEFNTYLYMFRVYLHRSKVVTEYFAVGNTSD